MTKGMVLQRWYVTSPYATGRSGSVRGPVAGEVVHAKELGSTRTVCGRSTETWHKFYALPFASAVGLVRCRECLHGTVQPGDDVLD